MYQLEYALENLCVRTNQLFDKQFDNSIEYICQLFQLFRSTF